MIWTAEGDYEITEHWAWLDMGNVVKFDKEGECILSKQAINASEYTVKDELYKNAEVNESNMAVEKDESGG